MKRTVLVLIPFFMFITNSLSCDIHGQTGIVEENNLHIPTGRKSLNGMSEEVFNERIDKVVSFYREEIESRNALLQVYRKWDNGKVNAFAKQFKPGEADSQERVNKNKAVYEIHMYGGLARHEAITPDGFSLVVCHELGHHLAGAPRKIDLFGGLRWSSNEGQADYWGTSKCFRKVFENDEANSNYLANSNYDQSAYEKCREVYGPSDNEVALCTRTSMAGKSLAELLLKVRNLETPVSFETPDTTEAKITYHGHSQPQCRLDTFFQASLCSISHLENVDFEDPFIGVCNRRDGHDLGVRPLCWWRPGDYMPQ